jgi:transcriptional regulator with XRE-family HTH domain
MPFTPGPEVNPLFVRARMALGLTQKELGERLGASVRTANRWEGGQAHPDLRQIAELARAVFPKDAGRPSSASGSRRRRARLRRLQAGRSLPWGW